MMTIADARLKDAQNARKKLGLIAADLTQIANDTANPDARHDLLRACDEIATAREQLTEAVKELRKEAGR